MILIDLAKKQARSSLEINNVYNDRDYESVKAKMYKQLIAMR